MCVYIKVRYSSDQNMLAVAAAFESEPRHERDSGREVKEIIKGYQWTIEKPAEALGVRSLVLVRPRQENVMPMNRPHQSAGDGKHQVVSLRSSLNWE